MDLRSQFAAAFDDLLAAWRGHDDVRRSEASIARLAESRRRLDQARDAVREIRLAFAPEERELASLPLVAFCSAAGESVFLTAGAAVAGSAGRYQCLCGTETVDARDDPAPIRRRPLR